MHIRSRLARIATAIMLLGTGGLVALVSQAPAQALAAGEKVPLAGYRIQSTAVVGQTGTAISSPGYPVSSWYQVGPRSTVLAGLVANGEYADTFHSTNMQNIPPGRFTVPWWYRADFTVSGTSEQRTFLDFSGVISKADVFVNGVQIAGSSQVAGAYTRHELDLTAIVRPGLNTVAFKIYPNDSNRDLTAGWVDWGQLPPDNNMGIVRDVLIRRTGAVTVGNARAKVDLALPSMATATVVAKAEVRNHTGAAVTTSVTATVAGTAVQRTVSLAAGQLQTVTFPTVTINNPQIWWPAAMGAQPLYDLNVAATVGSVQRCGKGEVRCP